MESNNFTQAWNAHSQNFDKDSGFGQVNASIYQDGDKSVRPPFSREHYEFFRPNEAIPAGRNQEELHRIMRICGEAYDRVGVIRSVIDLLTDFAIDGIEIVHEDNVPNSFYKAWSKRIKLEDRSERFLNVAYKKGNVVLRRNYGTINSKKIKELQNDLSDEEANELDINSRIPLKYTFYDPAAVESIGDTYASLANKQIYGLKISANSITSFKKPSTEAEKAVYNSLPQEIRDAIDKKQNLKGHFLVKLPTDKIYVGHYKKDDHDAWAKSIIYSVLEDVQYLRKLKQAKTSTLDSMVNVTRLWKLGDHKEKLLPHPNAGSKLAGIIGNHTGGGPIDIIWDSALTLDEFYPPIADLAGLEENIPTILAGLGLPEGLIGSSQSSSGNSNMQANSMNLKGLIKKIEYGRKMVKEWLETEIDIIQESMGFRKRPTIIFSNSDLHDEQVYFKLLLDLVDRNIISEDRILEIINEIPTLEKARVERQYARQRNDAVPNKAGPYHNPQLEEQHEHEVDKQKMSEKAQEKARKDTDPQERSDNQSRKKLKEKREPGRPPGSKDEVPRDKKVNSSLVTSFMIYDTVHDFVSNLMMEHYGVANARQLSAHQKEMIEFGKMDFMANIGPRNQNINKDFLLKIYHTKSNERTMDFKNIFISLLKENGFEKITNDQRRILMAQAYSILWNK